MCSDLLISACDWVNAITISANGNNENNSTQHSFEPVERMRRLIPYMTFYVAAPSREYLPVSDEYNYKQVVTFMLYICSFCFFYLSSRNKLSKTVYFATLFNGFFSKTNKQFGVFCSCTKSRKHINNRLQSQPVMIRNSTTRTAVLRRLQHDHHLHQTNNYQFFWAATIILPTQTIIRT